jgi:hypothetical protein
MGKKNISKNIKELMGKYKRTGSIGTSKPKSKKAAQKQAAAIAYQKANESVDKKEFVVSCDRRRLTTQATTKDEAIRNVCWRMAKGNKTRFQELKKNARIIKESFNDIVISLLN